MQRYLDLLRDVKENGGEREDRTGVGTLSVFGRQIRFNLEEGFPLLTTKRVSFDLIIHELLWFLSGSGNIRYLVENNVNIWNEWPFKSYLLKNNKELPTVNSKRWREEMASFIERIKEDEDFAERWGYLGPVYGVQWRSWEGCDGRKIDQIREAIRLIREEPGSRRIVVSGWNVADLEKIEESGGLPPCHTLFQFYVSGDRLNLHLFQRSADIFLGVPFNIASYSLLLSMVAQVCGLRAGEFVHSFSDLHIYKNHLEQVEIQLKRIPRKLPRLYLNPLIKDIDMFRFEDIRLVDYYPDEPIRAPIAV